ncbi:MAG TPA: tetratricopeptide repeat protein [Gemmataceae bacterium]|nr:tetratricopeptide repeat protein [Gemmataceae bacterium]
MRSSFPSLTILALALGILADTVCAQDLAPKDKPKLHVPLHPETKQELDHREALKLYGIAILHERSNRLLEATRTFEKARQLEPDAVPIHRALCPLYLALDRIEDGLAACRKVVELDPGDYEGWYLLARQYRGLNRGKDAIVALDRATSCTGLKERPELRAQVWFDLGVLRESAQEYAAAEMAFREVVAVLDQPRALIEEGSFSPEEVDTRAAETNERLGRVCLKAGHHGAAIEAFRAAQKKDARRAARLTFNLAEVYQAQGKLPEALQSLDTYLRTQPQSTEAYERRISILESLGRFNQVLPSLQQAADADKYNVGLKLLLAGQYAKRARPEKAKEIYLALLQSSPSAEAYRGLLALYEPTNEGQMNELLAMLDGALKEAGEHDNKPGNATRAAEARAILEVLRGEPKLVGGLLSVVPNRLVGQELLDWQTLYFLAVLAARAEKLSDAERLYRSCLSAMGRPGRHEQEAYGGLLQILQQGRKHAEIVEVCQQGLRTARAVNRVLFENSLAHAYLALDRLDDAVRAATEAADHASDENRCYCRRTRAHVLSQAGRYDEAVKECKDLLKEYRQIKDVREIRVTLSTVFSDAKKFAESEEQLRLLLEQDANDALVNNNLGYQLADEGRNLDEAEKLIRKALELDREERTKGKAVGPDADHENAAYLDSLGWVLFRRGRLADARKELEKAATFSEGKDDPVVWDHLGDVCARQSDVPRARAAWEKGVELYDRGYRRKADDRYKEIKQKLKILK